MVLAEGVSSSKIPDLLDFRSFPDFPELFQLGVHFRFFFPSLDTSSRTLVHHSMSVYTPLPSLGSENLSPYPKKAS